MTISATTQGIKPGVCTSTNRPSAPFDGQVIYMTDVDQTAVWDGTQWTVLAPIASGRNVVINGAMQVHQRGTSVAGLGNGSGSYYTADRWRLNVSGTAPGTWTQSIENDAPTGSGLRKSLKLLCTTAATTLGENWIGTTLEGQNLQQFLKGTSSAKQFTWSFWVKSNVTGTYIAELYDADNTRQCSGSYTISVAGTWEKKTLTFPADTTGAFDNDNALSLYAVWWFGAGSAASSGTLNTVWNSVTNANRAVGQTNLGAATSNYWQVTGVQLEAGAVATPFEFEDIGTTLAKCQRYYYVHVNGISQAIGMVSWYNADNISIVFQHPVTMRTAPTIVQTSGTNYYDLIGNGGSIKTNGPFGTSDLQPNASRLYASGVSGGVTGYSFWATTNNASASIAASAEL